MVALPPLEAFGEVDNVLAVPAEVVELLDAALGDHYAVPIPSR
jgi:hypothetical protein